MNRDEIIATLHLLGWQSFAVVANYRGSSTLDSPEIVAGIQKPMKHSAGYRNWVYMRVIDDKAQYHYVNEGWNGPERWDLLTTPVLRLLLARAETYDE